MNPLVPLILAGALLWFLMGNSSQLSPNYGLADLTVTSTGLPNDPGPVEVANLRKLATDILEPLAARTTFIITSGYRSPAVNSHPSVNGATNSHHMAGNAVDLVPLQLTPQQLADLADELALPLDELLVYEKHVHFSRA